MLLGNKWKWASCELRGAPGLHGATGWERGFLVPWLCPRSHEGGTEQGSLRSEKLPSRKERREKEAGSPSVFSTLGLIPPGGPGRRCLCLPRPWEDVAAFLRAPW